MKKILTTAAVGAAVTVGVLAGAGTANASSGSFIDQINAYGWHETVPGATLNLGYRTCGLLSSGYSWNTVVNDVYHNTDGGTGWSDASAFVSIANGYLC